MKIILISLFVSVFLFSCNSEEKEKKQFEMELQKLSEKQINFHLDAKPKYFSAKTMDGKIFNSKDYAGKYLMIFVYGENYLETKNQDGYDMQNDFNDMYNLYSDKVQFIGVLEELVKNDEDLKKLKNKIKLEFPQIDNTRSFDKPKQFENNAFCYPYKALINREGKVIYASCGNAYSGDLRLKLDSIQ